MYLHGGGCVRTTPEGCPGVIWIQVKNVRCAWYGYVRIQTDYWSPKEDLAPPF
jgi:hypothetical protein